MAYNNGYPASYYQQAQPIIWVQGEAGAKSYLVAPNTTVLLMDAETERFYLKSSDASGMPLPLRVFEYAEIAPKSAQIGPKAASMGESVDYVTKREYEAFKTQIEALLNKGEANE